MKSVIRAHGNTFCAVLMLTSLGAIGFADEPMDARKRKALDSSILESAKKFARSVAGDDQETYFRVLFSTLAVARDAKQQAKVTTLEREIEERESVLQAIRSPKSRVIGVAPTEATPTLDRSRSVMREAERRMPAAESDFAPRASQGITSATRSSARGTSAPRASSFFADPTWQKNASLLLDRTGGSLEPRIFNPNDDESRPVTDLPDCVSIGRPGQSCCTGTLIAPNIAITAAHCVPCGASHIYIGYNSNVPSTGRLYQIKQILPHPQYNQPTPHANDLAIVVLKQAVPVTVAQSRTLATTQEVRGASVFTAVGFGNTDEGNFGIKLEAPVAVRQVFSKEISAGGMGFDSCQGDSGGPLYFANASGKFRLAGVTSRGGDCGYGGIYVRVDAYQTWIQQMITANRP